MLARRTTVHEDMIHVIGRKDDFSGRESEFSLCSDRLGSGLYSPGSECVGDERGYAMDQPPVRRIKCHPL